MQQAAQELTRANSQDQSPNLYNYQVYQQQHRPQLQQIKSEVDPHSNGSQAPYIYIISLIRSLVIIITNLTHRPDSGYFIHFIS